MSCTKCVIRLSASADLFFRIFVAYCNFIALTLFVRHQEQHPAWLLKRCVGLHGYSKFNYLKLAIVSLIDHYRQHCAKRKPAGI